MRSVILQEFVTLDGLAAGPNDNVDFIPASTSEDRTFGQDQLALMDTIDTIVLGRVTYQMFAGYWPLVREGEDKIFADRLNATRKIVLSQTLDRAPWGQWDDAAVVGNSASDEVAILKQQPGKNLIIWGSLSLAQSLIQARLIDEYRLVVCPFVLGNGRALFGGTVERLEMQLLKAQRYARGAVQLVYLDSGRRPA